jgi:2-C-methyl-D-erythritol 4-phosphate cytidylyltransferase
MKRAVIVVAGGAGIRMGLSVPKQFLLLNNLPVLMHTLKRFYEFDPEITIIVVLPDNEIDRWKKLLTDYNFLIKHTIASGGRTRFHSVKNGLSQIKENCIIGIHDGVRPLCSPTLIKRCFIEAEKYSNAIPAVKVSDSIREVEQEINFAVDREKLRIIQTPQCFEFVLLKKAYENIQAENFTDDAGVFEFSGNKIHLVEGEKSNFKITEPVDLLIASSLEKELFRP